MRDESHPAKKNMEENETDAVSRGLILRSTQTYGVMIGLALLISFYANKNLGSIFALPGGVEEAREWGLLVGLGVGLILAAHELCKLLFPDQYRFYYTSMKSVLGKITVGQALYLATLSAIGEELLFRGALQPYLGLLSTSLILAILHVTPPGIVPIWLAMSFSANVMIGLIFEYTHSVYPGMLICFLSGGLALVNHAVRRRRAANVKLNSSHYK